MSKGTDTVPAMLTPGEFVMNRESTGKFFPLLKMMNAQRFNDGGAVGQGSVSVGDVNVSINSQGDAQLDARKIGKLLSKEISQRTVPELVRRRRR